MSVWKEHEFTCKPLNSYSEILLFLQEPPPWRSLCEEIQPHSKYLIKNSDLINTNRSPTEELFTEAFCHIDPDAEDVERHEGQKLPKTLVCHDMANGYHDDCIIDGTGNYEAYTFYNWAGIDIFCYFSHHLITIPPLGWINVGHAHGVKVIGTVITEWADGAAFWDTILKSEQQYKEFASALVTIAKTLKFDGWLLNVENKISQPSVLLCFVKHLHNILHKELTDPVLIWYDSVTIDGQLDWQNSLNNKNKPFFDACDGLFTNYSWKINDVISSAEVVGDRLTDLYIGLDVWGRNFYGRGKFNLQEAVQVAYSQGCSLAIFAPAWTHEGITTDKNDLNTVAAADDFDKYDQFLLRDRALWHSIWQYLNTRLPSHLPFKTSFCRGQGKKRRLYGEVLCPVPWYNLRHMQYQPNSSHGPHGYILSSIDEILQVTQQGLAKDSRGIIKFSDTIHASRQNIHAVTGIKEFTIITKETRVDVLNETTETVPEDIGINFYGQPVVKRKIKSLYKYTFKNKAPRNDDDVNVSKSDKVEDQNENKDKIDEEHVDHCYNKLERQEKCAKSSDQEKQDFVQNKDSQPQEFINENVNTEQSLKNVAENEDSKKDSSALQEQNSANINIGRSAKRYGLIHLPAESQCLEVYFDDSFIGGSCLKVNPSDECSPEHRLIRVLHCDFFYEDTLVVCVVTKNLIVAEEQFLNLKCYMKDAHDQNHVINLIGRNVPTQEYDQDKKASHSVNVYPINQGSDAFLLLQKYLLLNEPGFYVAVENSYNWMVRYYQVMLPRMRVTSINCTTGLDQGPILFGHLALCNMSQPSKN